MTTINGFEFTDYEIEAADDIRRTISRTADLPCTDSEVESLLRLRVWPVWGYRRFLDMLLQELFMQRPRALRWCCIAIALGYESHEIYGDIYSLLFPEITAEMPTATSPGGAS